MSTWVFAWQASSEVKGFRQFVWQASLEVKGFRQPILNEKRFRHMLRVCCQMFMQVVYLNSEYLERVKVHKSNYYSGILEMD